MSCCGQRRLALVGGVAASSVAPAARPPASVMPNPLLHAAAGAVTGDVPLRYLGLGPFSSRGARSGRIYACGGTGATMHVHPADAEPLLRTRLFARR